eukprot:COSAG02_NODE_6185_length_3745_cov_1.801152_2_plen_77_part_00
MQAGGRSAGSGRSGGGGDGGGGASGGARGADAESLQQGMDRLAISGGARDPPQVPLRLLCAARVLLPHRSIEMLAR